MLFRIPEYKIAVTFIDVEMEIWKPVHVGSRRMSLSFKLQVQNAVADSLLSVSTHIAHTLAPNPNPNCCIKKREHKAGREAKSHLGLQK
jgi:hypothetical protein